MNGLRLVWAFWDWFRELGHSQPEQRSQKLLRDWLSAEQRAQYDKHWYFDVVGSQSGRRYRIRQGTSANVIELDGHGRAVMGWCFVPRDNLASGDVMLAQKIALENDECGALKVARNFGHGW